MTKTDLYTISFHVHKYVFHQQPHQQHRKFKQNIIYYALIISLESKLYH